MTDKPTNTPPPSDHAGSSPVMDYRSTTPEPSPHKHLVLTGPGFVPATASLLAMGLLFAGLAGGRGILLLLPAALWPMLALTGLALAIATRRHPATPPARRRLATYSLYLASISLMALAISAVLLGIWMRRAANRIACQENLRNLTPAIVAYADGNGGRLPPDLVSLVRSSTSTPLSCLTCPDDAGRPAFALTPATTDADLVRARNLSYLYCCPNVRLKDLRPTDAVLIELPGKHGDDAVVLFGDFHQETVTREEVQILLQSLLTARSPATAPSLATRQTN